MAEAMHAGGSKPTGGEYTETITGRAHGGMIVSTVGGGGGGAGMFSALERIMKGAVWRRAGAICVCQVRDGAAELQEGGGAATSLATIRSG